MQAGKNLKPYQGLKRTRTRWQGWGADAAGKNLKPYQGLKLAAPTSSRKCEASRKKPKTLSGIETYLLINVNIEFAAPEKT